MFVVYLVKLVFFSLWFIARLAWSLTKLFCRLVGFAVRKVRGYMDAEDRGHRCRGQKRFA